MSQLNVQLNVSCYTYVHRQLLTNYEQWIHILTRLVFRGYPTKQSELRKRATVDILPPPPPTIAMQ